MYRKLVFATAIHFHPSRRLLGKARSLPLEWSPVKDPLVGSSKPKGK